MTVNNNSKLHHDNYLHYPSLYGNGAIERADEAKKRDLEVGHRLLDVLGLRNIGDTALILASSADGYGVYSRVQASEMETEAQRLVKVLECQNKHEKIKRISGATKQDLAVAITDNRVSSLYLLGHGSYGTWVSSDGVVDWYQAGRMVGDHLKGGTIANLGCGAMHSWVKVPFGKYIAGSEATLLGKDKTMSFGREMSDLSRFDVLKH